MKTTSTASFASARRILLWSGIAVLCAWVLVPIYLIALGAFGGRSGVYLWPKTGLPTEIQAHTDGAIRRFRRVHAAALLVNVLQLVALVWGTLQLSRPG